MTYRVQVLDREGRLIRRLTVSAPNQTVARYRVWRTFPQSLFAVRILREETRS